MLFLWNHIHTERKRSMEMMSKEVEDDIITLYKASLSGCTTTLEVLMDRKPRSLNKISLYSWNETPLHIAALDGHLGFTEALLLKKPLLSWTPTVAAPYTWLLQRAT